MKRFFIPFVLFFIFSSALPLASFAEGNRTVTILYSGSVKGEIDSCALCGPNTAGGLARRAHMVESVRKKERSVLLLDCGAVFGYSEAAAELSLKAMELMGYDALNLGSPEFYFGKDFLERTRSSVSFPYIASNLLYRGSSLPWTREYIIKEVGGIRVAILGMLSPDGLAQIPRQDYVRELTVIPPEAVLKRLLLEVKGKADLIVLLSRFGVEHTRALVNAVKGVDVAISSAGSDDVFYVKPLENTTLLQTGGRGKLMGFLKVSLDEKGAVSVDESRYVSLDQSVPDNEEVARLIETFKNTQATKK